MNKKLFGNEAGSISLLMAVSTVFLMITMYLASSHYIDYRAKSSRRITEAYRLIGVFEEVGKLLRAARDTSVVAGGMNWPAPNPACAAACQAITGFAPQICVPHPINPAAPYCFNAPDINVRNAQNMELKLQSEPGGLPAPTWTERAVASLFEKIPSGLGPDRVIKEINPVPQAYALPALDVVTTRADVTGPAPLNCDPSAPGAGCVTCGGPNPYGGGMVTCVTVTACPASYPGCVSGTYAGIQQTFFLIPGGYQR